MSTKSAKIYLDTNRTIAPISPLLFGGFAEHMGRCVYEGIYDPDSPLSDKDGLRTDVMDALREQQYSIIRYPGGNFLSGYEWLDGVGPKELRPRKRDLAWQSIETNQFGTNEFMQFCRKIDTEPMLSVNMGTGTIQGAADLVEYCNAPVGTYWSDLRAEHGHHDPYNVKVWCVGNEMDGPWQIGHLDINEYSKKALEAAKMMKWQDPSIKTVLCGSSNNQMPTFPEWDRASLERCWEHVDYHSIHYYADNNANDTTSYLAIAQELEDYVDTMAATLRYVKAKQRSNHDVFLSWDEWQVWYMTAPMQGDWTEAPHLSEEIYTLEDALVVAQWLNVFLRKCDVLKIGCVAQIVNTISWLQTKSNDMLKQSSFYPFKLVSNTARGESLDVQVEAPMVETPKYGPVSMLDVSSCYDAETGATAVYIVNRSQTETIVADLVWQTGSPLSYTEAWQLTGTDAKDANSWDEPNRISTKPITPPVVDDGKSAVHLPPLSYTVLVGSAAAQA